MCTLTFVLFTINENSKICQAGSSSPLKRKKERKKERKKKQTNKQTNAALCLRLLQFRFAL
jgi:hypothetical protein